VFSSENSQGHSVAVHSRALKEPVIQDVKTSAKKDEAIVALSSRHPASTWACRSLLHRASETVIAPLDRAWYGGAKMDFPFLVGTSSFPPIRCPSLRLVKETFRIGRFRRSCLG